MINTLYKLIILLILITNCGKTFGQFSLPTDEKQEVVDLRKSQILLADYKLGLLGYIKPEHSYHPTLGTFCVLENKIAKKTNFPVKMRLGSVDYVDKLEKKRN